MTAEVQRRPWKGFTSHSLRRPPERDRLHRLIERLVPWDASNDETILGQARWEIARCLAWARGEEPPALEDGRAVLAYLAEHAPPVYDPFCGGGSIPLEAQRLGLRAIASDLNPVAVLITKALVEIPPKFASRMPVHPAAREEAKRRGWRGRGAAGLAEDVRRYGAWMREEAFKRIGHLYPPARLPDGRMATSIAWIWARTVRSPNPAAKGAMVPLVSSFLLSSKPEHEVWLEPEVDAAARTYRFRIRNEGTSAEIGIAKLGTKRGQRNFECLLTGSPFGYEYVDSEANAGRLGATLLATVAEGKRGRLYLPATIDMEQVALLASPTFKPNLTSRGTFASNAQGRRYGFWTFGDYFTARQLVAMTTFADLVAEVRNRVAIDAASGDLPSDMRPLPDSGCGPQAYADAVATYLAIVVSRLVHYNCALCHWLAKDNAIAMGLPQQAITMAWDFAEGNPFGSSSSEFLQCLKNITDCLDTSPCTSAATVLQKPAQDAGPFLTPPIVSTDPPYYANVVYSDLSDFFYCWLRRMLAPIYPTDYATLAVPKVEELVANPYRHERGTADSFFLRGMQTAVSRLAEHAAANQPMTLYYAYNQSETLEKGKVSTGWAVFLQALHDAGICIDGTWPLRTQNAGRLVALGTNALASAIILACRRRSPTAATATRNQFLSALRAELPVAIRTMQQEALAPVDLQQAAIGPGIAVFTRYSNVLESDDSPMPVSTALALINAGLDEVLAEQEVEFDPATRFAVTWFSTFGFEEQSFGEAQSLARARAIGTDTLVHYHILSARAGRARLRYRADVPDTLPAGAPNWVQTHALMNALLEQGESAAAVVLARLGSGAEICRDLAYRLFQIAIDDKRKLLTEAKEYNALVVAWPDLQRLAGEIAPASQGDFLATV